MADPERISRLWLVLALALMYTVSLGSQVAANRPASMLEHLPPTHMARRTRTGRTKPKRLSFATMGFLANLAQRILNKAIHKIRFPHPNPWPSTT